MTGGAVMTDTSWMDQAACLGVYPDDPHLPDIWFPLRGDPSSQDQARAICAQCPVQPRCLTYALHRAELDGMWGGMSMQERHRLQKKLGIQPVERIGGRGACRTATRTLTTADATRGATDGR